MKSDLGLHEYREIEVWYNRHDETWECVVKRSRMPEIDNARLTGIYKSIDNFLNVEKEFDRFEVLVIDGRMGRIFEFEQRTVTSMVAKDLYWTLDEKGRRSQENGRNLIRITPKNLEAIEVIKDLREKATALRVRVDGTLASITLVPR